MTKRLVSKVRAAVDRLHEENPTARIYPTGCADLLGCANTDLDVLDALDVLRDQKFVELKSEVRCACDYSMHYYTAMLNKTGRLKSTACYMCGVPGRIRESRVYVWYQRKDG